MSLDMHIDYVYVSGLRATDDPAYVLAFDDEWNHDGDAVLFARESYSPET